MRTRLTPLPAKLGFSLVELSIVLVILGLLVGGVLAGKSLIRAAQLRSVTTQYQQILTAVSSFKDKYFALPGDMTNATQFWGVQHAVQNTCWATASTSALTCNGTGNGEFDGQFGGGGECGRFWQHLSNANMIEGQYSGTGCYTPAASNTLSSKLPKAFWRIDNYGGYQGAGNYSYFAGYYYNILTLGALVGGIPESPIMTPQEVWAIDTKLDDGKPATGKLYVYAGNGVDHCTDTANDALLTASYLLSSSGIDCAVGFRDVIK